MMPHRVLFLCTGNSCRSQMAEGWMRSLGGDQYEVFSAGTHPTTVNPMAVKVMKEAGIDISSQTSDSIETYINQSFDLVVTVCDRARETCPVFANSRKQLHWGFDDPAEATGPEEEQLDLFRRVRDEIRAQIAGYLSEDKG